MSDISYFTYPTGGSGTRYASVVVTVTNKSSSPDSPPFGYDVIDSAGQTVHEASEDLNATLPPSCYNLSQSQLNIGPGQTLTYPRPICFALSSHTDRITTVIDTGTSPSLTIKL